MRVVLSLSEGYINQGPRALCGGIEHEEQKGPVAWSAFAYTGRVPHYTYITKFPDIPGEPGSQLTP